MALPDPTREIRLVSLRSLHGANFWSRRPVTRLDLEIGAYDEISTADVPGITEALLAVLPGLVEHRCSLGTRGGFVTRLRRGTYAPHVMEHVALELQSMVGHAVGYGRARGGDRPGEYTVIIEHAHAQVGLRAAAHALELVRRAFVGTLQDAVAEVTELEVLAASPDAPALRQQVLCGITGGGDLSAVRNAMVRLGAANDDLLVEVAPAYVLNAGLPYSLSETAVILDAQPVDVPPRYQEADLARQLVSVLADAVHGGGVVVVPAGERELQEMVRDARCRVAVFSDADDIAREDARLAHAIGYVRRGRVVVECGGAASEGEPLRDDAPAAAQAAAALAMLALRERPTEAIGADGGSS